MNQSKDKNSQRTDKQLKKIQQLKQEWSGRGIPVIDVTTDKIDTVPPPDEKQDINQQSALLWTHCPEFFILSDLKVGVTDYQLQITDYRFLDLLLNSLYNCVK